MPYHWETFLLISLVGFLCYPSYLSNCCCNLCILKLSFKVLSFLSFNSSISLTIFLRFSTLSILLIFGDCCQSFYFVFNFYIPRPPFKIFQHPLPIIWWNVSNFFLSIFSECHIYFFNITIVINHYT